MINPQSAATPRILLILPSYFPESYGGGEQQTRRFARALSAAGASVTILAPRLLPATAAEESLEGSFIKRFRLGAAPNLGGRYMASYLSWWIQVTVWMRRHRREYDIIHIIHARLHAVPAAVAGAMLGKPVIAKIGRGGDHFDLSLVRGKRVTGRLLAFLLRRYVTAFIANSAQIVQDLRSAGISEARIHRIPNGIDLPMGAHADSADNVCRFVSHGRLDPEKRLEIMLCAFATLPPAAKAHLTIVGDGKCRTQLEKLAKRKGIQDRIFFAGAVDDVFPFLWNADFYLSTSESEGMSNALLEAMSCGVVPIITDVSGASDIVTHEVSGFLASGEQADFANCLARAASMAETERARMASAALETITQRFAMAGVAAQQLDLYAKQLSAGGVMHEKGKI